MPEKLDRCVQHLLDQGHNKSSAFAICNVALNRREEPTMHKAVAGQTFERFVPILKVDEERREVTGILALEEPDHTGEILDYKRSKPHFEAWSRSFVEATGGKSAGNLRAMHGNVAAGKFVSVLCDDAMLGFPVTAKVVDDNEWRKVQEGVYTGFSIGGKYGDIWQDGDLLRYEAMPCEGSLVDKPCIPGATFTMVRGDGSTDLVKFQKVDTAIGLARLYSWYDGIMLKAVHDAVAAGDSAIASLKTMAADMVSVPGDPDVFSIDDIMSAIRRIISARFSAEIQAEALGTGGTMEQVHKQEVPADETEEQKKKRKEKEAADAAAAAAKAEDDTMTDEQKKKKKKEKEEKAGKPDFLQAHMSEITKALGGVTGALQTLLKSQEAVIDRLDKTDKSAESAVKAASTALQESADALGKRLETLEKKPQRPGRPVDKSIGSGEEHPHQEELSKVEALIQTYEASPNADANVIRQLRMDAAKLAIIPQR